MEPAAKESHDRPVSDSTFRYVIIGGGAGIAATHLKALAQLPSAQVVGLSDISPKDAAPRAAELGCPFFTDHREMLSKLKPDIAVVCAPHPLHAPLVIDALQAGAHVLTEKPLTIEVAEADRMIAAADAANRILAVNFQQRFRPVIVRARQMLDAGEIGSLVRVTCLEPWFRTDAYYRSATWRGTWVGEAGGVLINQGPHPLDLLCYLLGLPCRVVGNIQTVAHAIETEDSAQAMLEYPNGATGYLNINTVEAGARRLEIVGDRAALLISEGELTIHRFRPGLSEYRTTSPEMWGSPEIDTETMALPGDGGGHVPVHQDLQAAIREKRRPFCDARDAAMSLELANAITLSSFTQQPVSLPVDRGAYHALLTELQSGKRTLR